MIIILLNDEYKYELIIIILVISISVKDLYTRLFADIVSLDIRVKNSKYQIF